MNIALNPSDWLELAGHFASLSLLGVGGAITTTPEMQRYLVLQQHWLSPQQFGSSIALGVILNGTGSALALVKWGEIGSIALSWVRYAGYEKCRRSRG